jgi:hypothetical protein
MSEQKKNNWDVSYNIIKYIEQVLKNHDEVKSFVRENDIIFKIVRKNDQFEVVALLVNKYIFGEADFYRARDEFPQANCIIIGANWNGYTEEAKDLALKAKIGLFTPTEFMGAINISEKFYNYVKRDGDGNPQYPYK